jgi:phosphotriesterase-related protein
MPVQTVLGPIEPREVGITLPHEHLIIDCTCLWTDPLGESWVGPLLARAPGGPPLDDLAHGPVRMEHLGDLLRAPHLSRDNLMVTDHDLVVEEVNRFAAAGGRTVVDFTNFGLGRNPAGLQAISRATGLNVVMGCGYYVQSSHPPELAERSVESLTEELIREIEEGIDGTGVRPGIIGEIGTGNPMTPNEAKVLRSAARAQKATGLPLNIHVSLQSGTAALDLALAEGVDPERVTVSHCDTFSNPDYQLAVAERGAWVSFDNFGANWFFGTRPATDDGTRVTDILRLIDRGYLRQILLSHDVGTKIQLTRFGGFGFAYISRYIEPVLFERGLSDAEVHVLRVSNPTRMLTIDRPVVTDAGATA